MMKDALGKSGTMADCTASLKRCANNESQNNKGLCFVRTLKHTAAAEYDLLCGDCNK